MDFVDLKEFAVTAFYIFKGTGITAALVVGALSLGFSVGLPLACLEVYGPKWLSRLLGVYVWFFRGVPILVLLFLVYFGVWSLVENFFLERFSIRLTLSPFSAALVALGLASGAYQSQIFRGSIKSLHPGQFKAAQALGFGSPSAVLNVIVPQALRVSIPAWSNEYSIILKDSAIAYVIGTAEIMARTKFMAAFTYKHMTFYVAAGVLFYGLTWLGVKSLKLLERKTAIPGLGHGF
ncbi:MAG: amino acid ABC transporter permease [Deltaproteobacteria bacterium]|jgi:polar amino acid transport system permease protein|nr:amino acid ABC transporter permease [Deltaproteobacteria bacterium]